MWLDILLAILAVLCLFTGLVGAVLPFPGPPLSFIGLLLLHYTRFADFSGSLLWGLGLATLVVTILDYYVPIWGLKKFGGSRGGIWGSAIGLLIGMFMGPAGIFIGAFLGGLVGELLVGQDTPQAFRAATGSFLGFLLGVGLKLTLCTLMIWYAGAAFFQYVSAVL